MRARQQVHHSRCDGRRWRVLGRGGNKRAMATTRSNCGWRLCNLRAFCYSSNDHLRLHRSASWRQQPRWVSPSRSSSEWGTSIWVQQWTKLLARLVGSTSRPWRMATLHEPNQHLQDRPHPSISSSRRMTLCRWIEQWACIRAVKMCTTMSVLPILLIQRFARHLHGSRRASS